MSNYITSKQKISTVIRPIVQTRPLNNTFKIFYQFFHSRMSFLCMLSVKRAENNVKNLINLDYYNLIIFFQGLIQ